MPYIAMIRSDIPNGTLQVLDLYPNTSLRNSIYDPQGQTKYVNRVVNDTVAALSANATVATYTGLAAYLLDHVQDNVTNITITVTVANAAALAFIAQMDASSALDVNAALVVAGGAGAGTTLTSSGGTGTITDVLKILAGGEYVLPSGSVVGGLAAAAGLGSFTTGQYRNTYDSFALNISIGEGQLAGYMSAGFEYGGTTGAAIVVYDDTGALM